MEILNIGVLLLVIFFLYFKYVLLNDGQGVKKQIDELKSQIQRLEGERTTLQIEAVRQKMRADEAEHLAEDARKMAGEELEAQKTDINADAELKRIQAEQVLSEARRQAHQVVEEARTQADELLADARFALKKAQQVTAAAGAMKNVVEGYGDQYLVPTRNLFDDLAETYGFADAGQELKRIRETVRAMMAEGRAVVSDHVDQAQGKASVRFLADAFNGRVTSILSKAGNDNFGVLAQEIRDAAVLVNHNGVDFKNTRLLPEYVEARIEELKCVVQICTLHEQELGRQRAARVQMQEAERLKHEQVRTLKAAAYEKVLARKELEKAQTVGDEGAELAEGQVDELNQRISAAEVMGRQALTLLQQTRAGYIYVASSIGSLGEHVYRIGMTRRANPALWLKESGDPNLPFGFDVHALIWSEDAPALETQLRQKLMPHRINKLSRRSGFFRIELTELRRIFDELNLNVPWNSGSQASREFRESQALENRFATDATAREAWVSEELAREQENQKIAPEEKSDAADAESGNNAETVASREMPISAI